MIWLTIVEYRRIKYASLSREPSHRK
jgi:hypothetical protein